MGLQRHSAILASRDLADASAAALTGDKYIVLPSEALPHDSDADYSVLWDFTTSGGTTGTLDGKLETSWDGGSTWHTVKSMTQVTTNTNHLEIQAVDKPMGPMVRVSLSSGGGTAPLFSGLARLISDDSFRLQKVG